MYKPTNSEAYEQNCAVFGNEILNSLIVFYIILLETYREGYAPVKVGSHNLLVSHIPHRWISVRFWAITSMHTLPFPYENLITYGSQHPSVNMTFSNCSCYQSTSDTTLSCYLVWIYNHFTVVGSGTNPTNLLVVLSHKIKTQ